MNHLAQQPPTQRQHFTDSGGISPDLYPGVNKQSIGLSSPIKTAPQLYLLSVMSSNFKHKATAEAEYKGAGGQSFMINVLLESYKKEKHFTYFTEAFYVHI